MLAGMLLVSAASMGQVKLGYLDSEALFTAMPERDSAIVKLEAYSAELQQQINVMREELQNKFQDYQKTLATDAPAVRASKETELQAVQERINQNTEIFQQDLMIMQRQLMEPIEEKMRTSIDKVSKANGITAVFDTAPGGPMLFHDPAAMTDLMPLVKADLGIK